jgi:hypothetical protein
VTNSASRCSFQPSVSSRWNGDLQALSFTVGRAQLVDQRIESCDK